MRTDVVFPRLFKRFIRSTRGVTAMEFAVGAPIAIFAVVGLIEMSMLIFVNTLVEGGLREASRFGITGAVPSGKTREEAIKDVLAQNTIGLIDLDAATITEKTYSSFSEIGQPEPFVDSNSNDTCDAGESYTDINGNDTWDTDMGAEGVGGPGDVVLYTISFEWNLITPLMNHVFGSGGKVPMTASVAVRNEPWAAPTTTTPTTKNCT